MRPVYIPDVGTQISVDNNGIKLIDAINEAIVASRVAAFLTGGTGAQSVAATWAAVLNGSFRITVDGVAHNVDAINFTGAATMAAVATIIQTALRAATSGLETVVWSTDHFVISSANLGVDSAITVLSTSTGTVGTDISGAGASDWMDADTGAGNGVVTENVYFPVIDWNNDEKFDGIDYLFFQVESGENVRLLWTERQNATPTLGIMIFLTGSREFPSIPVKNVTLCAVDTGPAICNLQIGFTGR